MFVREWAARGSAAAAEQRSSSSNRRSSSTAQQQQTFFFPWPHALKDLTDIRCSTTTTYQQTHLEITATTSRQPQNCEATCKFSCQIGETVIWLKEDI